MILNNINIMSGSATMPSACLPHKPLNASLYTMLYIALSMS